MWARIGAFEAHRDPGQPLGDALVAMGLAVDAGLDAIHVTAYGEPMVATGITDGHTPHARRRCSPSRPLRRELGVPVIAMGRLTPEAAEQALADGAADVIAMGRPLIADPDLPNKLRGGRRDRIRPCAYQYRCIGAIFLNEPVSARSTRTPATSPSPAGRGPSRRIVVAGGGPAGLECAAAWRRGHESSCTRPPASLGGMLRLAEAADPDLAGLLDWLVAPAEDAGVAIHLGSAVVGPPDADVLVWASARPGLAMDLGGRRPGCSSTPAAIAGDRRAAAARRPCRSPARPLRGLRGDARPRRPRARPRARAARPVPAGRGAERAGVVIDRRPSPGAATVVRRGDRAGPPPHPEHPRRGT